MAGKKVRGPRPRPAKPKKAKPFKTAGGIAGSKVGGMFGQAALGEKLGKWFGSGLGQLLGSGDYHSNFSEIAMNSIVMPRSGDVPSVIGSQAGRAVHEVRLRKREYLQDVFSSTVQGGFKIETFTINPGNGITFPWLSNIADSFEQYRLNGMIFEFKTMSGEYIGSGTTGSSLGSVIMATQYDVSDPVFPNKFVMENYDMSQSSKPSLSAIHGIECERAESVLSELYVSSPAGIPAGSDPKFFDFGKFSIASVGVPVAGTNLGELWVSYDVSLFKPKLPTGQEVASVAKSSSQHNARVTVASTACNFGTVQLGESGNIDTAFTSTLATYSGLNPGSNYIITFSWNGAGGQFISSIPIVTTVSGTNLNYFTSNTSVIDGSTAVIAPANVAGATMNTNFIITTVMKPTSTGVIALSTSGGLYSGSTVTNFDAFISLLDGSVVI